MPITREAILHIPKSQMSYVYDAETLHLRIRSKKGEVRNVTLRIGDPFLWAEGGLDGGNLSGADARGWIAGRNVAMTREYTDDGFDYWFAAIQPENKRSRYAFILEGSRDCLLYGEKRIVALGGHHDTMLLQDIGNFFCFPYLHRVDVSDTPAWASQMVWYQIFPDRFCNGDPSLNPPDTLPWGSSELNSTQAFTGGDLQGVLDKLDYLQELGVTGLYFCPVFLANSNHRYDTIDYYTVDPLLGSNETFRRLVDEAHRRGMKVMMDAVFNHIGVLSPQWQDVVKNGAASPYADWFYIREFPVWPVPREQLDGKHLNYETFGFVADMPKLNTENPACRAFLLDVARFWVEDMDCDAWRLDVANEVDHHFWRDFKKVVRQAKPDAYILGEIWHDAMPWLRGDQFDAVMNYPLTDAILDFFIHRQLSGEAFMWAVNKANGAYPRPVTEASFNLLESHDTSRVMGVARGRVERVRLAYAFLFCSAGSPCIFQGGEFGLAGLKGIHLENHRECMPWDRPEKQDRALWQFLRTLIRVRLANDDFCRADTQWLKADDTRTIAFTRGRCLVAINNDETESSIELPRQLQGTALDLLGSQTLATARRLVLPPSTVVFLKPVDGA